MKFKIGLFVLLSVTLLFSSCVLLGNQEQIDYSDGTQEADEPILETMDVQEIVATNIPTLSQTEIALTPVPSATVAVTQVFNPEVAIPESPIRISSPVEDSVLVSPFLILVDMEVYPKEKIYLQICDQVGTCYVDEWIYSYVYDAIRSIDILLDIEFDLGKKLFTPARLSLFVEDEFETKIRATSFFVNLFADGVSDQFGTNEFDEKIFFTLPVANASIKDYGVYFTGYAKTETDKPLHITLYNAETGEIFSEADSAVFYDGINEYGLFAEYLPYDVKVKTKALLIVEESSDLFAGVVHITSMPITLYPIVDPTATPTYAP